MKQRLNTPRYLVDLKGVSALDYIRYTNKQGLRIGALATLESVASAPSVKNRYPGLAQAADRHWVNPAAVHLEGTQVRVRLYRHRRSCLRQSPPALAKQAVRPGNR